MYMMGIDPSAWHTTQKHALGSLGANITAQGTKLFRYVRLRNESAAVVADVGDMLAWLGSPSGDTEANTCVSDNTDAATKPIAAGMVNGDANGVLTLDDVVVASIAGAQNTAYYGWVQTHGYAVANADLAGTPADGDALFLSTTDKTLTLATAADDPICAFAVDDSAQLIRLQCV